MKALSLWQPWATGIAIGVKRIETRSRSTNHRGPVAIHAAKRWDDQQRAFAEAERAAGTLSFGLAFGAIVAVADIVAVHNTIELLAMERVGNVERRWGDYRPGRFGYLLENVWALPEPIPFPGRQFMWELDDELTEAVLVEAQRGKPIPGAEPHSGGPR